MNQMNIGDQNQLQNRQILILGLSLLRQDEQSERSKEINVLSKF